MSPTLVRRLLALVQLKMADGRPSTRYCRACYQMRAHRASPGRFTCECPCHEAFAWLEQASEDPDEAEPRDPDAPRLTPEQAAELERRLDDADDEDDPPQLENGEDQGIEEL